MKKSPSLIDLILYDLQGQFYLVLFDRRQVFKFENIMAGAPFILYVWKPAIG